MLNTIVGRKIKMEQAFDQGSRVGTSVIEAGPCVVTQIKTEEKDGYNAVQLGYGSRQSKNTTKPLQGHLSGATKDLPAQAGKMVPHFLCEVRLDGEPDVKVGDTITLSDIFSPGDIVSVTGISKGKGFAGVMKRWNFKGGPRTHGQSDRERAPGSIGQGTTPGRVRKGKKMAGRMGTDRIKVSSLKVISTDPENNNISVAGPIPGANQSYVIIEKTKSAEKKDKEE